MMAHFLGCIFLYFLSSYPVGLDDFNTMVHDKVMLNIFPDFLGVVARGGNYKRGVTAAYRQRTFYRQESICAVRH
jgi:hypothetical protein